MICGCTTSFQQKVRTTHRHNCVDVVTKEGGEQSVGVDDLDEEGTRVEVSHRDSLDEEVVEEQSWNEYELDGILQ